MVSYQVPFLCSKKSFYGQQIQQRLSPEGLIKPAATIVSGPFLLSPFGIPFFVHGVPRILLAGLGGLLAGKVGDKVVEKIAENLRQVMQKKAKKC
jgi:hypothetical protein